MNYEKRYKEALERMKSWAKGEHPECFSEAQKTAEFIFPELKENEDDRIRKMLHAYIHDFGVPTEYFEDIEISKVLAWLEKQKEPDRAHHRVSLSDYTEYRKAYYDRWYNCNMQHSQKENEDNCVIRCLLNYFNNVRYNENVTWGTDKFHMKVTDIINWLEEQKTFNEVTEECERTLCEHLKKKYEL